MEDTLYYCVRVSPNGRFDDLSAYDLSGDLASVSWVESLNTPAELTIAVPDPFKVMGHVLREGMYVQYDLGTETQHEVRFIGLIYTVESKFPAGGVPVLTLKAYDGLKELGMNQQSRTLPEIPTLKNVVKHVVDVKDPPSLYNWASVNVEISYTFQVQEAQMGQTDLMFLKALCEEYDCMMYTTPKEGTNGHFFFQEAAKLMKSDPTITLSYGRVGVPNPMIEFEATVDADGLIVPSIVSAWDNLNAKPLDPVTRTPETPLVVEDPFWTENLAAIEDPIKRQRLDKLAGTAAGAAEKVKAMRLAQAAAAPTQSKPFMPLTEMRFKAENWKSINSHGMEGSGKTSGTPQLRANMPVRIDDVGGRFSGTWFVTEVRHTLDRDGYYTEFSCRR